MPFNIDEFKSNGAKFGFIRPAYFLANIARTPGFLMARGADPRFLIYLCSSGNLPGITVATSDERRWGYGPSQKIPYDVLHPDVTLTFYADGNGDAVAFFDEWMRSIVTYTHPGDTFKGASYGEVQYPSNYYTNLELYAYNEAPGVNDPIEILRYTLYDAFPISMSDISMDWSNDSAIASFSVTFAYRVHELQKNEAAAFEGGGIVINAGWVRDIANLGFAAANSTKKTLMIQAESILSGYIGLPSLANALNTIKGGNIDIGAVVGTFNQLSNLF